MLLKSYKGNIKQISSGSANHNKILVIFFRPRVLAQFFSSFIYSTLILDIRVATVDSKQLP